MRGFRAAGVAAAFVLALSACGSPTTQVTKASQPRTPVSSTSHSETQLAGTLKLYGTNFGSDCVVQESGASGPGGVSAQGVQAGANVIAKNAQGAIVATSPLSTGVHGPDSITCTFTFQMSLPRSPFYEFSVGSVSPVALSATQLASQNNAITLTVGSYDNAKAGLATLQLQMSRCELTGQCAG